MRLGIDFGTTRTVVAYADRGNYPVVSFADSDGDLHEYFPSVIAVVDGELRFGFDALDAYRQGAPLLRSFKRAMADASINPDSQVTIADSSFSLAHLLTGFLSALSDNLASTSTIASHYAKDRSKGVNQVVIAVPAHAHSAQRFLTLDAFRQAGFTVMSMMNEPSAAGFEYTHRKGDTVTSKRTRIIVYDLGGGTFDASLVSVSGTDHKVLDSLGINHFGGDDFDAELVNCALDQAGIHIDDLSPAELIDLVDQARAAKEHLSPQSRRIPLDVLGEEIDVKVADFYDSCGGLIDDSIQIMSPLVTALDGNQLDLDEVAGIYLVGGGSALPLVPRMLRQAFGRRVFRSPYPGASTAIGLAIAADDDAGYSIQDKLSRGFGVFRELSSGTTLSFDPIFTPDTDVNNDSVTVSRRYRPAHNIGYFRFVEYTALSDQCEPIGDIMPFATVLFPFTDELQSLGLDAISTHLVERIPTTEGHLIEERYEIKSSGIVHVTITDLDTGYCISQTWQ